MRTFLARSLSLPVLTFTLVLGFSTANSAAQEQPTVAKDSVQVTAFTLSSYKGDFKTFSWVPRLKVRVNGPVASGSQIYAEFSTGAGTWVKFDCPTEETVAGRWRETECGGRDGIPEDKGSLYTGPVNFTIKMRNELAGGDMTLFTGKMKVAKVHSNETGPNFVNHFVFYVDQDWNLPIGYVFYERDDIQEWKRPGFRFAFWQRGEYNAPFEPHLFHNGKEVGKLFSDGDEVGKASCGTTEVEDNTTQYTTPAGQFIWYRWKCEFPNVKAWNETGEENKTMFGPLYMMSENPGDYEIKIIYKGHLARSIKFAVDSDGKLVDNGIAKNNKLGNNRIIVPVQVLGDSDGTWDKLAWKTDAFYGNPLTGFTAP
ncbi:MAG TPA: hypothetical protein VLL54_18815 [Pyrinomonadaceae bacterium]|nr:hypothetical protein [Pyrinomonadaceae bacterium]